MVFKKRECDDVFLDFSRAMTYNRLILWRSIKTNDLGCFWFDLYVEKKSGSHLMNLPFLVFYFTQTERDDGYFSFIPYIFVVFKNNSKLCHFESKQIVSVKIYCFI